MKKTLLVYLITIIIVGFTPIGFANAITQNQINAEVQIVCPDDYGNWFSGSGTIIDPKGIILTNKHVVTDEKGGTIKACFIGFVASISQGPDFGTEATPNVAEVKYYTTSDDMDAAILYLNNPTSKTYPYVDIWTSDSSTLQFGNKIEVVGYPSIGGSTITYTSGDFSGFGSSTDGTQNYIKTTVPLEHGNSGGAAYNPAGQFIGIPTMVVAGTLNSLSYILSVSSVKSWLSGVWGNNYQQEIIEQKPIIEEPKVSIQNDVTPPRLKSYYIEYKIVNDNNLKKSYIQYSIPYSSIEESGSVKKVYYYFGENQFADPLFDGRSFQVTASEKIVIPESLLLSGNRELYFIVKLQDEVGNISDSIISPWEVLFLKTLGSENVLYNRALEDFNVTNSYIYNKYVGLFVKHANQIWWISPKDGVRFLVYDPILGYSYLRKTAHDWFWSSYIGLTVATGITDFDLQKKPKNVWGRMLLAFKDDMSGLSNETCAYGCYINPKDGKLYYLGVLVQSDMDGKEAYDKILSIAVDISTTEINSIEPLGTNNFVWKTIQRYKENNQIPLYYVLDDSGNFTNNSVIVTPPTQLSERLKGQILLQIESHGEAWYVNPTYGKRYYMKDGPTAYEMMRSFGLGITDTDLSKIPVADGEQVMKDSTSVCSTNSTANRIKGKILLQVQQKGEAWYVHPEKCRRIYMKDGGIAYQIMRFLSLGITNSDLEKIPEGNL
ncbi:TPA: hypothetical protein DIC39_03005 [Patescibacteria group bacterium]|nr:MAG: hypothetical protein A2047_03915 [Omnitrophica bacterium GWA2_41_15]HCU48000.1 hypothetical protein [Patescibacteria group bacterium]